MMPNNWLLPEFIADVLPSQARKIEIMRRKILDQFRSYGYELVIPPMLEYLESLLTGVGKDTELYTFKLIDQLSGRTMGLRADMTTQVARIDAHLMNKNAVSRLCYAGSILHTRPSSLQGTREPLQIGAELFGYLGIEADAEIQRLAIGSLRSVCANGVCLDLSHVGVLKALVAADPVACEYEAQLFDMLETKDMPALTELTLQFSKTTRDALLLLPELYGDVSVIERARQVLPDLPGISQALDDLDYLVSHVSCDSITIDLADMHGYHYHSGVMFAAYIPGVPNAIARGGRYDHVAEAFGRTRPATGFSMDLRELARILPQLEKHHVIRAPWQDDAQLNEMILSLREQGEIVVYDLPGMAHKQDEFVCDRILDRDEKTGQWIIKTISNE